MRNNDYPLSSPRSRGAIRRSKTMWQGQRSLKPWWLWVPAFPGTTTAWFVPKYLSALGPVYAGTTAESQEVEGSKDETRKLYRQRQASLRRGHRRWRRHHE